jgi:ADP-heptose:LPS heptosyltransferase
MNHTHLLFFNRHHYLRHAYERLLGLVCRECEETPELRRETPRWYHTNHVPIEAPVEGNYIAINPNAGELSLLRRWPIEFFQQLIEELLGCYPGFHILVVGAGRGEAQYCNALAKRPRVRNLVDRLSVAEMIRCIERASLVISNDSAPLHVALLSSVAVVGLFGPTDPITYVDMKRPRTRIHYTGIYCSPCVQYWEPPPCRGWNQCMREIRVEDVVRSSIELLAEKPALDLRVVGTTSSQEDSQYYPGLVYARDHDKTR